MSQSRYLPILPTPAQAELLAAPQPEALYAGTARSGKSTAVATCLVAAMERPLVALLVVPVLAVSPLPRLLGQWLGGTDARWDARSRCWRFPSVGSLTVASRRSTPGGGFQLIGVDDLACFDEQEYAGLLSLLTPSPDWPVPQLRAASSPDGPGRQWIARRFGLADDQLQPIGPTVIRTSFEDNPYIDATAVRRALEHLPEPRRSCLLFGDWSAGDGRGAPFESSGERSMAFRDEGAGERPPRLRALIGDANGEPVWFDPYRPARPLANCHVFVNGETGSGKTQTVKALVAELRAGGAAPLLLDRKDDYSGDWAVDQHL